jgi:transcriptional regulator with XRE-family HTH domain
MIMRLQVVRKQHGLTQEKFAAALDCSLGAYKTYERGERAIPSTVYEVLFKKFNVDPTWLFTGTDSELVNRHFSELEEVLRHLYEKINDQGAVYTPEKLAKMTKILFEMRIRSEQLSDKNYEDVLSLAC